MKKVKLGNTDILVSQIGLGTVKIGRNVGVKYPHSFTIPEDKEVLDLLSYAQELGINLIDTAPAYGNSEERLGQLLKETQKGSKRSAKGSRKDWVIVSKVGEDFIQGVSSYNFTPEHARFSIERSLKRLNTDYIDCVLVHSDGHDVYNIQHFGILDYLAEAKKQGSILSFGMSTKTVEGGLLALEKSDVVMVTFNPLYVEEQSVIQKAFEKNKGVLIKKALSSGHIHTLPGVDPVKETFKFIFKEPGVTSVIVGTLNKQHLAENVVAFDLAFT